MHKKCAYTSALILFALIYLGLSTSAAIAQTTVISYQGRLSDSGSAASGIYDLEFKLFDNLSGGLQQGQSITKDDVTVANGVFTVQLDFGSSAFGGADRYLEIGVRPGASTGAFTTLNPRQQITSTPYAIQTLNASFLGGVPASNYVQTNDARLSDARPASSLNFDTASLSGTVPATRLPSLAGDVTGAQSATVVSSVGGQSAASVAGATTAINTATATNTADTLVKRDASGNFSAGTISASLNGNATSATSATTATNFSGGLSGDVSGTQSATVVSSVGGQSASNIAGATTAINTATPTNTLNTIVKRDASGDFSAGTITATLNGNASTATTATTATNATSATTASTANAVSSSAGDSVVTAINASSSTINAARLPSTLATQNGSNTFSGTNTFSTSTAFSAGLSAGGQRITSVGTPTATDDAATKAYVDANIPSTTAGGDLTGSYPNPSISVTAGTNIVAAVNASGSAITTAHVTGDVELAPSAQQTASSTNNLINLKLVGARTLGTPGQDALLSLSASGHYSDGNDYDSERFRIENDGGLVSVGEYNSGCCGNVPIEGAGTRFMWYPGKAAIRAGGINGTQWDDANIGLYSTAFGENVRALGDNAVALGKASVAAGSRTVAIGEGNTATGYASVALGYGASTSTSAGSPRNGTFVFSDFSTTLTYFSSGSVDSTTQFHPTVTNSFNVRAVNGSFFYTNTALTTGLIFNSNTATMTLNNSKLTMASDGSTTLTSNSGGSAGVTLSAGGGAWNSLSDRNMKANFATVNPREILRGVLALPISTWNYKTQDASVHHIGPMAQDFFATFKVGEDDRHISTIDPDGVALAAIQGLNEELKDRDDKIGALQQQVRQQQGQIEGLKKLLCLDHPDAQVCKESK